MKKISTLILLAFMLDLSSAFLIAPEKAEAATAPRFQTASTNTANGPATITCTKPSGTVENDLLLAFVTGYQSDTLTISPPGDWSTFRGPDRNTGSEKMVAYVFYRIAGPSEGADYTFTYSAGGYNECGILRYSGVDTSDPLDSASSAANGNSGTRTGSSITTTRSNETLVLHSAGYNGSPTTVPAGMVERAAWDGAMAVYDETRATAGATGDRSHDQSVVSAWVMQMVAIKSNTGRIIRLKGGVRLLGGVRLR